MRRRKRGRPFDTVPGYVARVKVQLSKTPEEKTCNLHVLNPEIFEVLTDRELALFERYRDGIFDLFRQWHPDYRPVMVNWPPNFAD